MKLKEIKPFNYLERWIPSGKQKIGNILWFICLDY